MLKKFSADEEIRHHPERAAQAWQILVSMAMNRQTTTYDALSKLMYGKRASGVLNAILGHVAFYCNDHDLPPLTAIVVNKVTGIPGDGIPIENLPSVREDVYGYDWFDIIPPSPIALKHSYDANML